MAKVSVPGNKRLSGAVDFSGTECYIESGKRRGGRVVEGDGLENRYPFKGIAGSNPALSAIFDP